jgi:hypothetical protein
MRHAFSLYQAACKLFFKVRARSFGHARTQGGELTQCSPVAGVSLCK